MAESITVQLTQILDEYVNVVGEVVEKAERKTARDAVQKVKNTSPQESGQRHGSLQSYSTWSYSSS